MFSPSNPPKGFSVKRLQLTKDYKRTFGKDKYYQHADIEHVDVYRYISQTINEYLFRAAQRDLGHEKAVALFGEPCSGEAHKNEAGHDHCWLCMNGIGWGIIAKVDPIDPTTLAPELAVVWDSWAVKYESVTKLGRI